MISSNALQSVAPEGATPRPETAKKPHVCVRVHVNAGSVGFPVDNKSMIWREVPWSKGGFKEYPWTLNSMKAGFARPCLHQLCSLGA